MATPSAGKHPVHAVATPPVSTPFSGSHPTAFSPHGPKSVILSPQQYKKSPANSNHQYGHLTTSSFGAINFDSPTTAAALASLPLGDLSMDTASGVGLGGLGGGIHGVGRQDEDERKRKLQMVIDILKVGYEVLR
jgi:hypothetical protein